VDAAAGSGSGAVVATTAVVAYIGWRYAGMPLAAAVALGAIVAPPDAVQARPCLGKPLYLVTVR
jgi:CPA1 family monovalent cation:H+ antiporter